MSVDEWSARIIKWGAWRVPTRARAAFSATRAGTRSEWHTPTVFEASCVSRSNRTANTRDVCLELQVIAEEILPHVIFALFILLFIHIWYWSDDFVDDEGDDENDTRDEAPRHATERLRALVCLVPHPRAVALLL